MRDMKNPKCMLKINNQLHCYWDLNLLKIDLLSNMPEEFEIFEQNEDSWTVKYTSKLLKELAA